MNVPRQLVFAAFVAGAAVLLAAPAPTLATPANKTALVKHYDKFLPKALNACTTCHLPSENEHPESLADFPHNPFGDRLRKLGEESEKAGRKLDIPHRLAAVAKEDADGDGVDNQTELLLGHNPGNVKDTTTKKELADGKQKVAEWTKMLASYRWQPFETVKRPEVPKARRYSLSIRNPIDAFIAKEHQARGLKPRPEASKEVLLRRAYFDLIGLAPTPEEMSAFLADKSRDAYEKAVDRLLDSPRYGERWARHWLDVVHFGETHGYDKDKPRMNAWPYRDHVIRAFNDDKPYDRLDRKSVV